MDLYWVVRGQNSPVDYFNKYPGRFQIFHVKDNREIGQSGMVGFDAIFKNAKTAGVDVYKRQMQILLELTSWKLISVVMNA